MPSALITPPACEPLTLDQVKLHLRVDHCEEDSLLAMLISTARQYVEEVCGRSLLEQTWDTYLDAWPVDQIIVPRAPLRSVTEITYRGPDDSEVVWDAANYIVDSVREPACIVPAAGRCWPPAPARVISGIRIRFVAGWAAAADVPVPLKQAMLLLVAHWYQNREAVTVGNNGASVSTPLALAVDALLASYRLWSFA